MQAADSLCVDSSSASLCSKVELSRRLLWVKAASVQLEGTGDLISLAIDTDAHGGGLDPTVRSPVVANVHVVTTIVRSHLERFEEGIRLLQKIAAWMELS